VTRYAPLWQQNSTYPAVVDRSLLGMLWPNSASTGAAVSLVNNTMTVSIAPGTAAVALGSGNQTALCRWDAAEVLTLNAAPPAGQSRIDVIVLQVRDQAIDAGSNNDFVFAAVTGTPAATNPATPATPANAYALANVTVPGNVANLNTASLLSRAVAAAQLDVVKTRMYRAGGLVVAANSNMPFDTASYGGQWWNAAAVAFVCPLPGDYLVTSTVQPVANVGNFQANAVIVKNGAGVAVGQTVNQPTNGFGCSLGVTDIVPCIAGDQLGIQTAGYTGNANATPGAAVFFVTIRLLP
jgi:hypothetical protein